jgi:predicted RNA-binding Zn ribbon-like protein
MRLKASAQHETEWIDGFLFVGNHPALDLLNTRLVNAEGPIELLPDTTALERWVDASGLAEVTKAERGVRPWPDLQAAQHFLEEVLLFREDLRSAVLRFEAGQHPGLQFIEELNRRLLLYPHRYILASQPGAIERRTYLAPAIPDDLWREIAAGAAHLFTEIPSNRVRKCEGCVVNFYDTSKKGSRRWCSMQMCGNRDKVATYRKKQRAQQP